MCRTLQGHGHWVNILALSTDYVMRTGAFDPANANIVPQDSQESGKKLCGYNSQWIDKQKFINSFLPSINSVNLGENSWST